MDILPRTTPCKTKKLRKLELIEKEQTSCKKKINSWKRREETDLGVSWPLESSSSSREYSLCFFFPHDSLDLWFPLDPWLNFFSQSSPSTPFDNIRHWLFLLVRIFFSGLGFTLLPHPKSSSSSQNALDEVNWVSCCWTQITKLHYKKKQFQKE